MSSALIESGVGRCARSRQKTRLARAINMGIAGLGAGVLALGVGRSAFAADPVWNGGVANWGDPTAWDTGIVPNTPAINATIGGGQATLDSSYSIGALTMSGGVINGTNDLTINGLFNWTGGAMADAGTTRATAGIVIDGSVDKVLNARLLINDGGTTAWNAGNLILANGAIFINAGTFTANFDGDLLGQGTPPFFINSGLFQKTAGAGGTSATTITAGFNNSGTVQVQAGRLVLAGGGSATGTFDIASGTSLVVRSDYIFGAASSVSGSGAVGFEFGSAAVNGAYAVGSTTSVVSGSVAFNSAGATTKDLMLSGGVLTGSGTIAASGAVAWTGTVLQGSGAVVSNGTLDISGPDHGISARTLVNAGTGTWSSGNLQFSGNATLSNTGTLENTFAGMMQTSGATPGQFNNAGLFIKSSQGETVINPLMINSGTTRITAGALTLAGGGSGPGSFDVQAGTTLRVQNDFNFSAGSRISGSGSVEISGGINTVAGTFDITGGTAIFGGITTFSGPVLNLGPSLSLFSGFTIFNTPSVTANKLDQFGGGIDGSGNVTFNGLVTWDSGPQKGSGTTTAAAGLSIQGPAGKSLEGRTLVNAVGSSGTWSAGDILGFGAGTLRNDGTLLNTFDANFLVANGAPAFVNTGLFIKSGGAGITSFGAAFNNSGTARVDSGSLYLTGGTSTGNLDLAAGGVQIAGSYNLAGGATITGTNKALLTGVLNVSGNASVKVLEQTSVGETTGSGNLSVENFSWLGGRLTGTGTTTVTSAITISGADGKEINGRRLRIEPAATATWSAGDMAVYPGSVLDNAGTFDDQFSGNIFQNGEINNSGLFLKSAGGGLTTIVPAFNNTGIVRVQRGSIFLGAGSSTGNFDLVGGTIGLAGGYGLGNGATITGTNNAVLFGLVNVLTGTSSARFLTQGAGSEMSGPGNLTIDHFTWSGGRLTGTGTTTVTIDAALNASGKELNGRTLKIAPTANVTWSAGDISGFPGGLIDNAGTFTTIFDGNFLYASTQSAAFANSGLFLKAAGTGKSTFTVFFNNSGTARVASGTLSLLGGGNSSGNFDLQGGGLELTGGYVLGPGTTITGSNTASIIGDISVTGSVSAKNVVQTTGTVSGTGALALENFVWQGGTMGSGGLTSVSNTLTLSGVNQKTVTGRTLRNAAGGATTWSGGDLRIGAAGAIENLGTFTVTTDNSIFPGDGAIGSFSNSGLFDKTAGAGFTSVFVPFNNSGVVRVDQGSLALSGGGSATGQFDLLAGPLELSAGYTLGSGASITGTNKTRIVGDVNVTGNVSAKNVDQTAGVQGGGGTFTIESFTWTGGSLGGAGVTRVTNSLTLSGASESLDGRTLNNAATGQAVWSSGTIFGANGARIVNDGLFVNGFDGTLVYQTGTLPVFDNTGEFRKSAGAGTTQVGFAFNNTGTARVNTGTLRLIAGGSASGNFDLAAGAQMELGFDYTLVAGASITGAGKTRLTGGVLSVNGNSSISNLEQTAGTISGPANLTVGQFDWKGGILSGSGSTTATTGLTITGTDFSLNARTLAVAAGGAGVWNSGDIRLGQGGTINNAGTFDIAGDMNLIRVDGSDTFLNNTGLLRKDGGTNFAAFQGVLLNNTGTVEVSSGTLIVGVAQFDATTSTLTGGTWRVLSGGKLDLGGGAGIATNLASVTLDGATASFPKINDVVDNRGLLALKNGKQFFTGGTFANSGTVSVDAASAMNFGNVFNNAGTYTSAGTTAVNFAFNTGIFTQTAGALSVPVQFVNNGTGAADLGGAQTWGNGAHLIVNGGSAILRSDAGSTSAANLVIDAKGGTTQLKSSQHLKGLNVDGGTVTLDAGGNKIVHVTTNYAPGGTTNNWNGKIDLANNRLIVEYSGGSVLTLIRNQIKTGYANGAWTGNGIVSSAAQADPSKGLGFAEASEVPAAALVGESVAAGAVVVRYTLGGDANLSGKVDFTDLVALAQNYNANFVANPTTDSWWTHGDFNYDGKVDFTDLVKLAQNYNAALPSEAVPGAPVGFAGEMAAAFAAVPEPGAVALVLGLGISLPMRRRRR
jgi:hypothetical protein